MRNNSIFLHKDFCGYTIGMSNIYDEKQKQSIYRWRAIPENREKQKAFGRAYMKKKYQWIKITKSFRNILIDGY